MLDAAWEELKAQKLVAMMEAAIQRRFPAGVKLHVHSSDRFGCLAELNTASQSAVHHLGHCQAIERLCWVQRGRS